MSHQQATSPMRTSLDGSSAEIASAGPQTKTNSEANTDGSQMTSASTNVLDALSHSMGKLSSVYDEMGAIYEASQLEDERRIEGSEVECQGLFYEKKMLEERCLKLEADCADLRDVIQAQEELLKEKDAEILEFKRVLERIVDEDSDLEHPHASKGSRAGVTIYRPSTTDVDEAVDAVGSNCQGDCQWELLMLKKQCAVLQYKVKNLENKVAEQVEALKKRDTEIAGFHECLADDILLFDEIIEMERVSAEREKQTREVCEAMAQKTTESKSGTEAIKAHPRAVIDESGPFHSRRR
ncbi:hypothetical protein BJ508DRAFT_329477 [Ascobolus immersus RN42]|uniref:Uncharacterized protein n=1 Tax=Ascobolus immersus RN42 TaxID=1160509 RepID=A0A3N4HX10_ASCIM|nr:hypothetical protein BJ508DRAFT_329477 [Ascobolus immersus RN42]